jgi:hypothetical protein
MLQSRQVQGSGRRGRQSDAAIGKIVSNGLQRMPARTAAKTSTTRWKKA